MSDEVRTFSTDSLPGAEEAWGTFRKTSLTQAVRVDGPFVVETSAGPLRCEDGWLAVDARGYPYPIAADEFELIYEMVATVAGPAFVELEGSE